MLGIRSLLVALYQPARRSSFPGNTPCPHRQGISFNKKEVVRTNYIDIILGILLIAAFLRGLSAGFWRSLFGLGSTAAAFGGAYLLAGPASNLLERNYGILRTMSSWWNTMFSTVPGLAAPYDPNTFGDAFSAIGGGGWARAFQGALQHNILAVQELAGSSPTWASVLGLALARMVLSAVVFLVLLSVLRLLCNLMVGSLAFGSPVSFSMRFAGAILEVFVSAVWLSIIVGALSPVLSSGILWNSDEALASSVLVPVLLKIYAVIWPALVAKII